MTGFSWVCPEGYEAEAVSDGDVAIDSDRGRVCGFEVVRVDGDVEDFEEWARCSAAGRRHVD